MKALRLSAVALAVVVLTWSSSGRPALAATRYVIDATLAYCKGGGTACSLYKGNYFKSTLHVEGPPTGAHSGVAASFKVGCVHAYRKGGDRVLDRSAWILPTATAIGAHGSISGTAKDDDTPNVVKFSFQANRTLTAGGQHRITEFTVGNFTNTQINNGLNNEAQEHLVSGGFSVIAKGQYLESFDYSDHVFHRSKWVTGTLLCQSGAQPHVPGHEGVAYDWDAEVE